MTLHTLGPHTTLEDCNSTSDAKNYFQQFSNERLLSNVTPAVDAALALRKLRPRNPFLRQSLHMYLRPDQIEPLEQIVATNPNSWDAYCDVLDIDQIKCVGW